MNNDNILEEIKKLSESLKRMENELTLKISNVQKELKGLVEIQQRLIHERLKVPVPPPPSDYPEEKVVKSTNSDYKIQIVSFGNDRIRVSGNTFDHRPLIKSCGPAKWENEMKSWSLPASALKNLIEKFKEVGLEVNKDIKLDVKNIEIEEDNIANSSFGFIEDD